MLRVLGDERGGISILAALVIIAVVGCAALALEYGNGLLQQVEDQRIADLAAYSAALVYNSTGLTSSANSAAQKMASLNGLGSSAANASVGSSPTGDGNQAVQVTVSTSVPLLLARVLTTNTTIPVNATATAEISANAAGCVIALSSSGSGISLSGTGSITADSCAVASNSTVCADSGANPSDVITTKYLSYGSGSNPNTSKCTISPPAGTSSVHISKSTTADPFASNSEVTTATSRISTVASITSPSGPSVTGGTSVSFGYSTATLPSGCTDIYASSAHTVTCIGTGPFNFGSMSTSGSVIVTGNNSSSGATYNFSGAISSSGSSSLTFNGGGSATYNIAGGVTGSGSSPMSFSAGTFNIGTMSCNGNTGYSICLSGSSTLTIAGPSAFTLAGGIYQDASGMPPNAALNLGYGTSTNIFKIGKGSDGYSLNDANGATLFGDATGTSTASCSTTTSTFCIAGSINTTGGTCVGLSAANEHDINGSISGAGGIVLGSGIYTVNGYVALGNSSGGNVSNCPTSGATTGLTGLGVTLVISGASTVSCGSTTSAFCLGAGFATVVLTAPTSSSTLGSSTAGLAVIGPQSSSNTAAATFTSGATNTRISGAFYFPNGQIYMSGAATLQDTIDSGACLELIGSQITSSAGTSVGSTCSSLGGGSSGTTVGLVK